MPGPTVEQPEQLVELEVGAVAHGGSCVARLDGRVVFVRHTLPGERVVARVTDTSHDRYWRADAVRVLRASPDRVRPPCPHAGPPDPTEDQLRPRRGCGGCDWQHATPAAQRKLAGAVVAEALRRLAGIDVPVDVEPVPLAEDGSEPAEVDGTGWRTRVRFAVTPDGVVGLRQHRSHRVVAASDCLIAHPAVTAAVAGRRFPGAEAVEVAVSPTTGSVSIAVSPGPIAAAESAAAGSAAAGSAAAAQTVQADELVELVRGRRFSLDPSSFWQVHPGSARTLVAAVLDGLAPRPGAVALDLYAGAGLFAAFLAEAVGPTGQVIAMESDPAAVASAARSLADLPQVSLRAVRVTPASVRGVQGLSGEPGGVDLVVLDPPRAGAGPEVVAAVLAHRPRAVAYVACDPASLGRDLAAAAAAGYELARLRAFALFPMTSHVECVAILTPR